MNLAYLRRQKIGTLHVPPFQPVSPYNRRITAYEFHCPKKTAREKWCRSSQKKASAGGLDKIWLKSGTRWARAFSNAGLKLEAKIPGYLKAKIQQVSLPCI